MSDEFGFDVEWKSSGYLFLSHSEKLKSLFEKNIEIQRQYGLNVSFISAQECKEIVPLLDTTDLLGAAWCPSDGQANPFLAVRGYADGVRSNGGRIRIHSEVKEIRIRNNRVQGVTTSSGEKFDAPVVVNAAGPWAKQVGAMAGLTLDVEPDRHEALITEGVQYEGIPMLVDYRADGGYFVQRLTGQFIGCFTPEKKVPGYNTDSTLEFLVEMSRRMCRIIPALENVAVLRQWAGSYSMTPDGSPIVDRTPVDGFFCSVGMSGHGFMLGPALGLYLADFIVSGKWQIPMEEFSFGRSFGEKESMA
jgi:sarcosine oxidase subunit beta